MNTDKKIQVIAKRVMGSAVKNLPQPLAALALQLRAISPEWALIVTLLAGGTYFVQDMLVNRDKEFLELLEQNKDQVNSTLLGTDEVKTAILNIFEKHRRQISPSKRLRLRQLMLSASSGKPIKTDEYDKFYRTIESMTDEEAVFFAILMQNTDPDKHKTMNYRIVGENMLTNPFTGYEEYVLIDAFQSLHSYRLINITIPTIGGGLNISQITTFGEKFYEYIITPETKSLANTSQLNTE